MFRFSAVLSLLALVTLLGCGPVYKTHYDYTMPASAEGRLCVSQCQQTQKYCNDNCRLKQERCEADARVRGDREYDDYVRERRSQGKEIKRSRSSFYYGCYEECDDCDGQYHNCFATCGGNINSRTVCEYGCDRR